MTFVP